METASLVRDAIGWLGSLILVPALARQTYRQWKDDTSAGVSMWLYLGSLASNVCFIAYSALLHSWVFVVTNALLLVTNVAGIAIVRYHRHRRKKKA